jgi:predicted DsbA family dithiol-disulfide isomerase
LSDDAELARTREEAGVAARSGVEGVPFFVFGGRVGVSGAQPLSVLRSAIEKATQPTA